MNRVLKIHKYQQQHALEYIYWSDSDGWTKQFNLNTYYSNGCVCLFMKINKIHKKYVKRNLGKIVVDIQNHMYQSWYQTQDAVKSIK